MIADRCWKVIENPQPPPARPAHVNGHTPEARAENRKLECAYREDIAAYEQRSGADAAMIRSTLTLMAESYVKGLTNPLTIWNTLRERLSPLDNVGRQQALRTEFDLLTFIDKEDINVYFEKLRDYQYNLEGTTLAISDAELVSKVLSTLPLTWRSQIRHLTDSGTATWESIEKSLRNIQAEQAGSKPASRAFAVSKREGKGDKCQKNSGDNDKKSSAPPILIYSVGIVPARVIPAITAISRRPRINLGKRKTTKSPPLRPPPRPMGHRTSHMP